jgi:ADP-ribose pyrophosphatase YjhB (NUDIX family)
MRGWQSPGFRIRATGLILNAGRVLVHSSDDLPVSFWALPGGGPEFQEFSHETVVRELREELHTNVVADRLAFIIEHTFRRRQDGNPAHHIDFVYLVHLQDPEILAKSEPWIAPGLESYGKLLYHWLPLDQFDDRPGLYPVCLRSLLLNPPPETPVHVTARASG